MAEATAKQSYEYLNKMLVEVFHEILEIEETSVQRATNNTLTMTEIHTLTAISGSPKSMSEVASSLGITVSTLTIAVNRLEKKEFVLRERDASDRRVVRIQLTNRGRIMVAAHERFHKRMTRAAIEGLSEQEVLQLTRAVSHLKEFFYKERESHAK